MPNKIYHADLNERAPKRTSVEKNSDLKASHSERDNENSENALNNRRRLLPLLLFFLGLACTALALGIPLGLCKYLDQLKFDTVATNNIALYGKETSADRKRRVGRSKKTHPPYTKQALVAR